MDRNEQILSLVKQNGPVIPSQIAKLTQENILMTSARLSELLSNKNVKISTIKVGGSPLYFAQGQEPKLQNFKDSLGQVERKAYDLLQNSKILQDSSLEPQSRVAMRAIKDFAIPLQVTFNNENQIFWKWYLAPNDDAQSLIKNILQPELITPEPIIPEPKQIEPIQQITIPEKTAQKPFTEKLVEKPEEKVKPIEKKPKKIQKGPIFLDTTISFFNQNNVEILEKNIIKKTEINYIVRSDSNLGQINYYCVSKDKKRINEGDISSAYLQAQSKNLPLLFLTPGELAKKAKELVDDQTKNILFKSI